MITLGISGRKRYLVRGLKRKILLDFYRDDTEGTCTVASNSDDAIRRVRKMFIKLTCLNEHIRFDKEDGILDPFSRTFPPDKFIRESFLIYQTDEPEKIRQGLLDSGYYVSMKCLTIPTTPNTYYFVVK